MLINRRVHVEDDEPQQRQRWRCENAPWCSCPDCEPQEQESDEQDEQQ